MDPTLPFECLRDWEVTGRWRSGDSEVKRNERVKKESAIVAAAKAVSLNLTPETLIDGDPPPPRRSRWWVAIFAGSVEFHSIIVAINGVSLNIWNDCLNGKQNVGNHFHNFLNLKLKLFFWIWTFIFILSRLILSSFTRSISVFIPDNTTKFWLDFFVNTISILFIKRKWQNSTKLNFYHKIAS